VKRIVLVGATGAFGARLASLLAAWPDTELVLAARRLGPLKALARELRSGAKATLTPAVLDRDAPDAVARFEPWAVVDTAGPFQHGDFRLARAAIAAGAHYVDIADARDFVAAFPEALHAEAQAAGVLAVTGASSTPALSQAALEAVTKGWTQIDTALAAISPGARAPRGRSVVEAILSYVGRPVRVFLGGRWIARPGWSGPRRLRLPGLGLRWGALCETPDLDLIPARFHVRREALFLAGLEQAPVHLGLWLLSWLVRLRLLRDLRPLTEPLRATAGVAAVFGSDRGGMLVRAQGLDQAGARRTGQWSLAAEANAGPTVPVAAAAAMLRGLADGRVTARGAFACVGLLALNDITAELAGLPIRTERLSVSPDEPVLFRRVLGDRFARLAPAVQRLHGAAKAQTHRGRGWARGCRSLPVRLIRAALGLPEPGRYGDLAVEVEPVASAERWTRRFGSKAFSSQLRALPEPGVFQERFGPIRFVFDVAALGGGFVWRFQSWSLGSIPLPKALAPRIRARAFEANGAYRFRVATAHPWLGLIFAYAGRLDA
jgi:hypothetical protein